MTSQPTAGTPLVIPAGAENMGAEFRRYSEYVRLNSVQFTDALDPGWGADGQAVLFARAAMETAISPVMSPPYLRTHPRVYQIEVWSATTQAIVVVDLVAPRPGRVMKPPGPQHRRWRDWPTTAKGEGIGYYTPLPVDLDQGPFLFTTVRAMFGIPATSLRHPKADGPMGEEAALALLVLVNGINEVLAPVVRALESGGR